MIKKEHSMNCKLLYLLTVIFIAIYSCNISYADDFCYPDQYPFDGCEEVTVVNPLSTSVEVLAQDTSGTVQWEGGRAPFLIRLSGEGFYINDPNAVNEVVEVDSNSIVIHSTANSCGAATVSISDGCSETVHYITQLSDLS